MLEELLGRAGCAEALHADEARPSGPMKRPSPRDRAASTAILTGELPMTFLAVGFRLIEEEFGAGNRNDAACDALGLPALRRRDGDSTSEPEAKIVTLARHRRRACKRPSREVLLRCVSVRTVVRFWRVSASTDGWSLLFMAICQHSAVSDRVGRAEDPQVRNGAQPAICSTGWWVGPSSPTPIESCVMHVDDADAHQRGQADRRAAIIREDHEAAAIGDEAAVQRDAVHGGGHAVLADAPVHVAAGEVCRRDRHRIWLVLVLLRGVRSAEPPIVSGTKPLMTSSASSDALRVAIFGLVSASFSL